MNSIPVRETVSPYCLNAWLGPEEESGWNTEQVPTGILQKWCDHIVTSTNEFLELVKVGEVEVLPEWHVECQKSSMGLRYRLSRIRSGHTTLEVRIYISTNTVRVQYVCGKKVISERQLGSGIVRTRGTVIRKKVSQYHLALLELFNGPQEGNVEVSKFVA